MAKDRRDREVATRLQEVAASLPAPGEADAAAPAPEPTAPITSSPEQRMMAAVDVLEALPVRERLGVLQALLPVVLDELDAASRSSVLEELFLEAELTPAT